MLILTRKTGETLRIGDNIVVTIVARDGQQTKVGISAPPTIPVHREEVYQRIRDEDYRE